MNQPISIESLPSYIDHSALNPDAMIQDIKKLCEEALQYSFRTVCVNSVHVPFCVNRLAGCPVGVCSVIGFPLGAMPTEIKAAEASWAVAHGATEIDMVIAIGFLKSGDLDYVKKDIEAVHKNCGTAKLKVILETGLLDDKEITDVCVMCKTIGVAFVKTSTGFGHGGATVENVALMKSIVGETVEVKASGGIKTFDDAVKMIHAGATRLGTSSGVELISARS